MNVVKGALTSRTSPEELFVRRFTANKSYGTLIDVEYDNEMARRFPRSLSSDSVGFQKINRKQYVKVIEWMVPKVGLQDNATVGN
jgi:hypothetical protein